MFCLFYIRIFTVDTCGIIIQFKICVYVIKRIILSILSIQYVKIKFLTWGKYNKFTYIRFSYFYFCFVFDDYIQLWLIQYSLRYCDINTYMDVTTKTDSRLMVSVSMVWGVMGALGNDSRTFRQLLLQN